MCVCKIYLPILIWLRRYGAEAEPVCPEQIEAMQYFLCSFGKRLSRE